MVKKKKGNQVNSNSADYANDLNRLYARFDCYDVGCEREEVRDRLANTPTLEQGEFTVTDEEIHKVLTTIKSNKAVGPDGVSPNVLSICLVIKGDTFPNSHITNNCEWNINY